MPNLLLLLVLAALLACFLGLSLGALGLLLPAVLPRRVESARGYLRTPSLWMGLAHLLMLLFVLGNSDNRTLIGQEGIL